MMTKFQPDRVHYEREYILGEGLNSTVWRAKRVSAGSESEVKVALKFLKDQSEVSFLRREFDTLQRINSSHCGRVIAWESFEGTPVLVLEWIDGITLDEFARSASFSSKAQIPRDVVDEIVGQIHQGLCDLRSSGVCHGDLHPGNIMINREGRVRLIDFASGRTASGLIQATPAFLAPEVWTSGDHSHEADLFALGVIRANLATRFANLDRKARAKNRDSLLHANPSKRSLRMSLFGKTRNERKCRDVQERVAHSVHQILAAKQTGGTQLLAPEVPRVAETAAQPSFARRIAQLAVVLAAAVAAPVFADDQPSRAEKTAQIVVTAKKWVKVTVNGQDAGYSPVRIDKLEAGTYRVEWESATEKGSTTLKLKTGEIARLKR